LNREDKVPGPAKERREKETKENPINVANECRLGERQDLKHPERGEKYPGQLLPLRLWGVVQGPRAIREDGAANELLCG